MARFGTVPHWHAWHTAPALPVEGFVGVNGGGGTVNGTLPGTCWHSALARLLAASPGTALSYADPEPAGACPVKSHRVPIPEAVQLTRRSRRSLYRDMAAGHLAYHVGPDSRRMLDVSELIRAYGALPGMPDDAPETPAVSTVGDTPAALLTQMLDVMREQSATLAAQREEMAALREEVAELRRLPAPWHVSSASPQASTADDAPTPSEPPTSMADILARFESRYTRH